MLSFANSSNPAIYPIIPKMKFVITPHIAIHAMCRSVTWENRYSPCLLATLSVFGVTSNSSIASHQKIPLVNSEAKSGTHIIGTGFLK